MYLVSALLQKCFAVSRADAARLFPVPQSVFTQAQAKKSERNQSKFTLRNLITELKSRVYCLHDHFSNQITGFLQFCSYDQIIECM